MDETAIVAALRRHWEYAGADQDIAHEIYHEDAVLEFPQSQERFVGKESFKAWRSIYPAVVEFRIRRLRGQGTLWIAENSIRYDGGPWNYTCNIVEFRGERVARETIYITQGWDAPEWRARWRAPWENESPAG